MSPVLVIAAVIAGSLLAIFDVKEETVKLITAIVILAVLVIMR